MSTKGSAANLVQAAKDLLLDWEQTKSCWRDVKSQEFEREYLGEIPNFVTRTIAAMQEVDELLKKVRSDCE
jgi:hypothetical protein